MATTTGCMTRFAQPIRPLLPLVARSWKPRLPPTSSSSSSSSPSSGTTLSQTPPRSRPLSISSGPKALQQPARQFTYNIAASYIAKDRPFDPSTHVFHFSPYNRVQPARKRSKRNRPDSGQDAFFVTRVNETTGVALGVADGVGGWIESGVDPADFSHAFCDYVAAAAYSHNPESDRLAGPLTARSLMQMGYEAICADPLVSAGGSTALVGLLHPSGILEVANLGDSRYMHLRLNAVHASSEPQTHAFNTPFQLSVIPPWIARRMQAFGGSQLADLPSDAEVYRHSLRHGDVLIFATDGAWDNLFNQDVLRIVSSTMRYTGAWIHSETGGIGVSADFSTHTTTPEGGGDAGEMKVSLQSVIATSITAAAKAASINTKLCGPFATEVKKYYPLERWSGGKVDDICVLAVVVSETPPQGDNIPVKADR